MADTDTQSASSDDLENTSLEGSASPLNASSDLPDESLDEDSEQAKSHQDNPIREPSNKRGRLKRLRQWLNIYLVLLIAVVIMGGVIVLIAYEQNKRSSNNTGLKTQNLSQSTLSQLANSDSTVGSSQYVLNVESNAIFAGQVITRQSLEVAGNLQVGGSATFNNLSVAGTGQFSQATISNNLTVGGNNAVQGSETIAKTLQVNGGGTFAGNISAPQITTSNLQLNGDFVLQHHISVTGSIPNRSGGPGLGSGGSVSINGSDTAGSININTGSSPTAGCFVTITFTSPYSSTPYVLVTPVGLSAGGLSYYVNRSTTNFSVCDASTPPVGSSFSFDYFVVD